MTLKTSSPKLRVYVLLRETVLNPETREVVAASGQILTSLEFTALCAEFGCDPDSRAFCAFNLVHAHTTAALFS